MSRPGKTHLFKVQLRWMPEVWRTIEVREDQTLHQFHRAIQRAFNWDDDHLYSFFLSGKAWDKNTEYASPYAEQGRSSVKAGLGSLGLRSGQRFLYLFDYGDQLEHEVEVLGSDDCGDGVRYPHIVEAHGEAPPQYPEVEEEEWEEDE